LAEYRKQADMFLAKMSPDAPEIIDAYAKNISDLYQE